MDYTVGQRFQLKDHHGYKTPEERLAAAHGDATYAEYQAANAHHPLFAGQIGTVVAVVPAEEEGAGNHEEEHVVLSFEARVLTNENDPTNLVHEAIQGHPGRNVSFTQSQMDEMFQPVAVGVIEASMSGVNQ